MPPRPGGADQLHLSPLDYVLAGIAATGAGAVNAMAGGGTLISFPTLLALGVPAVSANVTNTVSLPPGHSSGAWTQRDDLRAAAGPGPSAFRRSRGRRIGRIDPPTGDS